MTVSWYFGLSYQLEKPPPDDINPPVLYVHATSGNDASGPTVAPTASTHGFVAGNAGW